MTKRALDRPDHRERRQTVGLATCVLLIVVAGLSPAAAAPVTVLDTGPGEPASIPWGMDAAQWLYAEFTVGAPVTITSVEGWMSTAAAAGDFTVALYGDGGNVPAGTPGTGLFSASGTLSSVGVADWYGPTGLNWAIGAGTYWIGFEVRAGQVLQAAMRGQVPAVVNWAFVSVQSAPDLFMPAPGIPGLSDIAVRILGNDQAAPPVPEPVSLALLATGLMGTALRRRRNLKG